MLSNQLPLLQMGQKKPEVTGRIREICHSNNVSTASKMFKETRLVAFSDPNDLLSYAIPQSFLEEHIDSRLCPSLTNVILNVAKVNTLLGGEFANPLTAHTEYDADATVVNLISYGIGPMRYESLLQDRCTYIETVSESRQTGMTITD